MAEKRNLKFKTKDDADSVTFRVTLQNRKYESTFHGMGQPFEAAPAVKTTIKGTIIKKPENDGYRYDIMAYTMREAENNANWKTGYIKADSYEDVIPQVKRLALQFLEEAVKKEIERFQNVLDILPETYSQNDL